MFQMDNQHTHTGNQNGGAEKHCHHPYLKEGTSGEKICVACGRLVYSGNNQNNSQFNKYK
jgi:hypothetical protein